MHDFKLYSKQLNQLVQQLDNAKHRQCVLITGENQWCYELLTACITTDNVAILSEHTYFEHAFWPQHIHQLLGQEFTHAVYDGFCGLHPDKLAALAGTVQAAGILFVLLPELSQLSEWQDPALSHVQSYGHSNKVSYFNQRFSRLLAHLPIVHISQLHGLKCSKQSEINNVIDFTEQRNCIEHIIQVATGRANRPLLINADRGRGKSAALGLSAAKLSDKNIIICATQFKACHSSFKHLAQTLNTNLDTTQKQLANLRYVAPDALLSTLPQCDVLFVDEAAAIPVPMLQAMLQHYPRIIFASTLVGYEGNGRGYTLRFTHYLKSHFKAAKIITLKEPLRFAKYDPLEQHIRTLLALDAQHKLHLESEKTLSYAPVTQLELVNDESLLQQIVALLAMAHYQSSVNDLRHLLDSPTQRLFIAKTNNQVAGVCLIAIEGMFSKELSEHVIAGKRRPQGHLMAQTMAQLSSESHFLTQQSARIVRIAIAPKLHSKGFGSEFIHYIQQQLKQDCQWIGASFGANTALLHFWQKNHFKLVKLGFMPDKATAEHAALVIKPLHDNALSISNMVTNFESDFPLLLLDHFNTLDVSLVAAIVSRFSRQQTNQTQQLRLAKLLQSDFQLHTVKPLLWRVFWQMPSSLTGYDENTQYVFIRLILQNAPVEDILLALKIAGKKALNTQLKIILGRWNEHHLLKGLP
ncbi:tRNA(Met) cytidine acetyltransferase [Pseudoalteromonas sp. MMG010]|uniref:GNAT family N-acetyltransferase n=1 Tax=Pseudoalteromonas sp. MMG010 TaxID=2822685 RepID=UPI001B3A6022|nr:GNAT family N-acetyltransferase [Pseudoalteromonas sp. MMG010]MBQ4834441.1 tRNA(Met) cytidine acetyltransferase [Pseudoalteromonas sp. MMG010]